MDLQIKDKRALVLASSEGLGKAVAQSLIEEGAKVIISSRSEEKLLVTLKEIGAFDFITCDLSVKGAAADLVKEAAEKLGGLDILVTNAGGPPAGTFNDITDSQWEKSFQSLFMSLVESIRVAELEMAKAGWGRIIMITSVAGKEPIHNLTISNAIRAGVHGLMNTLSKELASKGITVNALLPTYTETERLKDLGRDLSDMIAKVPVGRLGVPEELGKLATFLASNHAGFITGQAIGYDGGSLAGV